MQVSQEKLLQYIHFNRQYNTLLIEHNTKLINQLRMEMDTVKPIKPSLTASTQLKVESVQPQGAEVMLVRKEAANPDLATTTTTTTTTTPPGSVKVLVRKEVDNPVDFDKTYAEYREGFSANGLLKKQSI